MGRMLNAALAQAFELWFDQVCVRVRGGMGGWLSSGVLAGWGCWWVDVCVCVYVCVCVCVRARAIDAVGCVRVNERVCA